MADAHELFRVLLADDLIDDRAGDLRGDAGADRGGAGIGLMQHLHEHQAGDEIDLFLPDGLFLGGIVVILRLGDESDHRERRGVLGRVGEILRHAALDARDAADLLEILEQLLVAVDLDLILGALHADALGAHEDDGVGAVHDGGLDRAAARLDDVDRVAGRQELAGGGAGGAGHVHLDESAGAGHARDGDVAGDLRLAVLDENVRLHDLLGVYLPDGDLVETLVALDDGLVDRERGDAGGDVAAVAVPVNDRVGDGDLGERVVHVAARLLARADDGELARQRIGAGQTVDLALIGGTEDLQDHGVALGAGSRQIVFLEENALAGTGAHDDAGNSVLIHGILFPS